MSGASFAPVVEEGKALVLETVKAFSETLGLGLFAGTGLSVTVL